MNFSEHKISIFKLHYEANKSGIFNYVKKILKDEDEAKDVTHDVFLKLFDNLEKIRDERKIKAWLFITAKNEILMKKRFEQKFSTSETTLNENYFRNKITDPQINAENNDLKKILEQELENLTELNREIFILREYANLSYEEIAKTLALDVGKVKSRLFKTRKKLIEKISKRI